MLKSFEVPKEYLVEFKNGNIKVISKVMFIKTGRRTIFGFIAKDHNIHKHRYEHNIIKVYYEITKEQSHIYKIREFIPKLEYRGTGVHSGK